MVVVLVVVLVSVMLMLFLSLILFATAAVKYTLHVPTVSFTPTLTVVTPCESVVCGKNSSRSRLYKEEGRPVLSPLPSPFYAHAMGVYLYNNLFISAHGLIMMW